MAQNVQRGAQGAASSVNNQFQRFVEGSEGEKPRSTVEPERKDFWDSFGGDSTSSMNPTIPRNASAKKSNAIGTSAMKASGGGEGKDAWGDDW